MLRSLATSRVVRMLVVLLAGAVALVLVVLWRLERGPIRLAFLDGPITRAISALAPELTAEIGGVDLARAGRGVTVRVSDLRLRGRDGTLFFSLPEVAVRPSLRALARGRFLIGAVRLSGARLALVRTMDGELRLGAGEGAAELALAPLLAARAPSAASPAPLPRITLEHASVTLDDRRAGGRASLTDSDLVIRPGGDRLEATFAGRLQLASDTPPVRGAVTLPVRARVSVPLEPGGTVGDMTFTLDAEDGEVVPPSEAGPPLALQSLAAEGTYFPRVETVRLTRLAAVLDGSRLEATASLILGREPLMAFDGRVDSLALGRVTRLWPVGLATAARSWVTGHVPEGTLRGCRVQLGLHGARPAADAAADPTAGAPPPAPKDAVDVRCDFDGVHADYLPPLEPVHAGAGSARLTADRLDVEVRSGALGPSRLEGGRFVMHFDVEPPRAEISVDVSGASADVLALVEPPPLRFASAIGIAPRDLGGRSRVHAELALPLASDVDAAAIAVTATAALEDASLPVVAGGIGITGGRFDLEVDGPRIAVKGTTTLTGIAALTAPVAVDLAIEPAPAKGERRARLVLDGNGLLLRGAATLVGGGLAALAVERFRFGRHDLTGSLQRQPNDEWIATLGGASLDLESLLAGVGVASSDGRVASSRVAVDLRLGHVRVTPALELRNLRGTVRMIGTQLEALALDSSLAPSGVVQATLDGGDETRRVMVRSDEAGRALAAVGFGQFVGGTLRLDATTDRRGPHAFLDGELVIETFKLVGTPILAKILALGSLGGIAAMVQGDGLPFSEARLPFRWENGRLDLRDVRAIGAIGLTADGTIDTRAGTCDVAGNVIPSYTLNTVLGRIPLLGALVGGKDQGLVGIAYRATGPTADPTVRVDRLPTMGPGVLREWFVKPFTRGAEQAPR